MGTLLAILGLVFWANGGAGLPATSADKDLPKHIIRSNLSGFPAPCRDATLAPQEIGADIQSGNLPLNYLIINEVRAVRAHHGRRPANLLCEEGLMQIARDHSVFLARTQSLHHVDNKGRRGIHRLQSIYPSFRGRVAENLGYKTIRVQNFEPSMLWRMDGPVNQSALARWYVDLWMKSPSHRKMFCETALHILASAPRSPVGVCTLRWLWQDRSFDSR